MQISHLTESPTRGVIPVAGTKRPSKIPPFLGITTENVSLFKMAYLTQKFGGEDGFKKVVGR